MEYFAKLKKELEEIEEENEKILDGLKKDYGISWEKYVYITMMKDLIW